MCAEWNVFPESLKGPSGLSSGPRGPGRPSPPLRGPRGPSLSPSGPFNASENTVHTALIFLHARAPPCKLEKYQFNIEWNQSAGSAITSLWKVMSGWDQIIKYGSVSSHLQGAIVRASPSATNIHVTLTKTKTRLYRQGIQWFVPFVQMNRHGGT